MNGYSFSIVKKIDRAAGQEPGVQLSSFKADRAGGSAVITGADNASVKESVAAFRSMTGLPIGCRVRGKSIQVFSEAPELWQGSALYALLEFLKGISFASEDVLDVLEFCALPAEHSFGTLMLDEIDMDRSRAEIGAFAGTGEEPADPEDIYAELMPQLERYGMGIIKQERSPQLS